MRERTLLEHVFRSNARLPDSVTILPGDDMGAIDFDGRDVLAATDQVADGVHVDTGTMPLEKVGRKAVTRNLSDIAAMGALPAGALVAACLPRSWDAQQATRLFDAMRRTAESYACPLFGGDVGVWDGPMILTVTVLARTEGVPPLTRYGARAGDVVCVTGDLGGSLEKRGDRSHHLDFEPRLVAARALATASGHAAAARPHCMIDLSDGLATDLAHLCRAGGVSAVIDADRIPISAAAHDASTRDGLPPWRHALADGEDYELCFTITSEGLEAWGGRVEGVRISGIGEIVASDGEGPKVQLRDESGRLQSVEDTGWEHG